MELIKIKQLPVIENLEEKFKKISIQLDEKIKKATSLVCTEDTVKIVKNLRADLRKEFDEYETDRKQAKQKIMEPYNELDVLYKKYISDKFNSADTELKQKIDSVENELKARKEQEVKKYFEEYKVANEIDFVKYEQAKINVTLSSSMKSLKEQVKSFIDIIVDDLNTIETQEHKTEILVEYKQNLNVNYSIQLVKNRYTQIDLEKKKQEEIMKRTFDVAFNEIDNVIDKAVEDEFKVSQKNVILKLQASDEEFESVINILDSLDIEYESEVV